MEHINCLVTGANCGLGYAFSRALAREGATVIMFCHDAEEGKKARIRLIEESQNPNIDLITADLTSLSQIRRAAEKVNTYYHNLHLLANLATTWFPRHALTPEGIERHLAANILGPFLLTNQLWPKLTNTAGARVINLSSESHRTGLIHFDDPGLSFSYSPMEANRQAALARVLWTYELARRSIHTSTTCNVVATDWYNLDKLRHFPRFLQWPFRLLNRLRHKTAERAAEPMVRLALDDAHEHDNGIYFVDGKRESSVPITYNQDRAQQLWGMCQRYTGTSIPIPEEVFESFISKRM